MLTQHDADTGTTNVSDEHRYIGIESATWKKKINKGKKATTIMKENTSVVTEHEGGEGGSVVTRKKGRK